MKTFGLKERHAYAVHDYMEEKHVIAEIALTVMGDLVLPPQLPKEIDPFNGCILDLVPHRRNRPLHSTRAAKWPMIMSSFGNQETGEKLSRLH